MGSTPHHELTSHAVRLDGHRQFLVALLPRLAATVTHRGIKMQKRQRYVRFAVGHDDWSFIFELRGRNLDSNKWPFNIQDFACIVRILRLILDPPPAYLFPISGHFIPVSWPHFRDVLLDLIHPA